MIRIADLTERDVGREVIYTAPHGAMEEGVVKSWNDKYIFVKYGPCRFQDVTAAATKEEQLDFKN